MESTLGSRTPPPRLVDIKFSRPQSMVTPSSINPTLVSRRRTSRSHHHGTVDTVPELRRFNTSGTKSSMGTRPRHTTSQSYGSLDTISPRRERETMKDLSDFLTAYDPPAHNLVAPPQTSPRKRFSLLRRKQKKEPKSNQFLRLPDTAISAKTRQGVKYIAISIPLEHDYLGRLPTLPESVSQSKRPLILDRGPVIVHKPVYNVGESITPPPGLPMFERKESYSKKSTCGPGTMTKVITKPGSEEVILQNGYIQRTSQVYTPIESIYHDASETRPISNPSKGTTSSGPPFKVTLVDDCRANSLNSVSRPVLWRHESDGPLRVVNRTPSPDIKPTYQSHRVIKSISTVHSVATTGTGIRQSLKSTLGSVNTNSSAAPAVFGTAETIDLQSFMGTIPGAFLASPQSEKMVQFRAANLGEPKNAPAIQATSLITPKSPKSPQVGSNEKKADQAAQMSRREKVRAKKERDVASLRSKNSDLNKSSSNSISTQSIPDSSPTAAGISCLSNPSIKSAKLPARSSNRLSKKAAVLSTSNIMLVADLPPFISHVHQSDLNLPHNLPRPLSPASSIPSPSRLPRPKFIPTKPLHRLDNGKSVYVHHSTQTRHPNSIISAHSHTSMSPISQWQKSHRTRPNSEPFAYPRLENSSDNYDPHGLDMDRDLRRKRETSMGMGSPRERELDVRLRIIERDTDVLLRTLGEIARSFDNLVPLTRMSFGRDSELRDGVGRGTRSSVIGGVAGEGGNGKKRGERGEGSNRKRAATTGMGMENRNVNMDMVMRDVQLAAPKIDEESVVVGEEDIHGDNDRDRAFV
ncbi:hypothetical protein SBOR_8139 [Sclerotinia borealis F-4128]|uniref:Uncharacterized protein n=1 Tax=Sclerotinia borealis (strain F-4128) TaxID=1432307 RepID=W9C6W4_SCLBF|nr:hypothetical protein SBOR_8139 [Sclerotinia borealis F-4128]